MALFIGLISGTSMDGIDAAVVDFSQTGLRILAYAETVYPADIRAALAIAHQSDPAVHLREFKHLDIRIGRCFADAALHVLKRAGVESREIVAIGSHGQTVLHSPETEPPFTLQIGDPATIAVRTGITTVADFRSMDIAAGGQGAPLVPAFHGAMFRTTTEDRAIVNIGGIANITFLPADISREVVAFDTGPGNCLMDEWTQQCLGQPFDRDGVWAATGRTDSALLTAMLADPFFQKPAPKSTGRDYFNFDWLSRFERWQSCSAADVAATLLDLTAKSIASALPSPRDRIRLLVCGGGAANKYLLSRLAKIGNVMQLETTGPYGLPPNQVEACAFAWLAAERLAGRPIPAHLTGARSPQPAGAVYLPGGVAISV